jgi:two-component system, response regulator
MSDIPHILIAEDDADDRLMIGEVLDEIPRLVSYAFVCDGEELLVVLSHGASPSLILLDLNMPKIDGRQALQLIRSKPEFNHIPVIVFTTSVNQDDRARCLGLGANDYIAKPASYADMRRIVNALHRTWLSGSY